MRRALLLLLACFLNGVIAAGQQPDSRVVVLDAPPRSAPAGVRQEAFDIVWQTVKQTHFDPNYGGLDWDKVRERYAPRVPALATDQELYKLLREMLGELGQSHFTITPPEAVIEEDSLLAPRPGGAGVQVQIIDSLAVISRVEPGSAAARAGLRPGFLIQKIDGTSAEEIRERFQNSARSAAETRIRSSRAILARIDGRPGTSVRLVYLDERDRTREVTLERELRKGELSERFGNFPPLYTELESLRLPDGIGYIRFNLFVPSLMDKIRDRIRSMSDSRGLIIDLRGNPGGIGGMSAAIAGLLETKQTSLGTMTLRAGHLNMAVFPQANPFVGPVAILIDGGSASTSEIFAAGLQELGRAVIVGERSMGAALPSMFQKLPTGALFQYAHADFKTPNGVMIEGRGVIPDLEVKLSRSALLGGRDNQLDAAIDEIRKRARPQTKERTIP